jgi:integrase
MLSKTFIKEAREPGKHRDDNNLYLVVAKARPAGGTWQFIYSLKGRARAMGLGKRSRNAEDVRAEARRLRKLLEAGIDPLDHRAAGVAAEEQRRGHATTFSTAVASYLAAHGPGWRSAVVRRQTRNSLATYAESLIGDKPVSEIGTEHVLAILVPIWNRIPVTADNLRLRIERVLDYARARGWRDGENPATWRGRLKLLLPAKGKLHVVKHHAALDWQEAPAFMAELRTIEGMPARALEFLILTAARSGEVRGALWNEIDAGNAVWTVPPRRENHTGMKTGKAHRVPLSGSALAVLDSAKATRELGPLVFPSVAPGRLMADNRLIDVLRRMGHHDLTVHGFRSTFRDWAAEATAHPNHVVEQALAHVAGDKVERAYRRGDLFQKRRQLMDDWATYLARPAAEVVRLAAAG